MLRMAYWEAVRGFSSTLSLAILTAPPYLTARSSMTGSMVLQGPHQGAQQSTRTEQASPRTSREKFWSFTSTGKAGAWQTMSGVLQAPQRGRS